MLFLGYPNLLQVVPFSSLNETMMSHFFHNGILLLLLDILRTALPRLLKLTTVTSIPNTVAYNKTHVTTVCLNCC